MARGAPEPEQRLSLPVKPNDYRAFTRLVREHLRGQGIEVEIADGYASVPGQPDRGRYGLEGLAQACAARERREWPATIARHFDTLRRAEAEREATGGARSFAQAAPLLAVRLWPEEFLQQIGESAVIFRRDLPGLITVLVYDLPETIQQVRPEEPAAWGKTVDELYALGLDNLRRKPRPEIRRVVLPEGGRVTVFSGQSFFVASDALRLAQFPGCSGRHGALVGLPTRHVLLAYPIDDAAVVKAMPLIVRIILEMARQGPGTLSPRLYWYHDGHYADLPYKPRNGRPQFAPPVEFSALVAQLASAPGRR